MKKILIGLTGPARSGKDTVAQFLTQYGFNQIAFADPIREGISAMLCLPKWRLFSNGVKDAPIYPHWPPYLTPRYFMEKLGTEWGRDQIDPQFWLWLAQEKWEDSRHPVVVSDVRFEEEAAWVRSTGGFLWHIRRDIRQAISGTEGHPSRRGIPEVEGDTVIDNNSSLDYLGYSIRQRVKELEEEGLL